MPPSDATGAVPSAPRALDRRLVDAGVDPGQGVALSSRKPQWARAEARIGPELIRLRATMRELDLVTVCEEAGCPNIFECWADGTATFMINGERCTRACGFCLVDTRRPLPLDPGEPDRVAEAVARMRLTHAVVTAVARDDLADGGAQAFAETIAAIRRRSPRTTVEVLIPDCKGDDAALNMVFEARPEVLNHNLETVNRLQRAVRPSASYARSLSVLARSAAAGCTTKSGIILGMGETVPEVVAALGDLRAVGVEIVTIGQYLRPTAAHLPVARWWAPSEFEELAEAARAMGFAHVEASPLTRSSYHAKRAVVASAPAGELAETADVS
ncbi:MAG: lipoyl synthase [Acidimicrobiales bacterium]